MKKYKIFAMALIVLTLIFILVGCGNRTLIDTTYTFDEVIASLPDGTIIKGKVEKWTDYDDGDQIQVRVDGKTYLLHASNVVLIAD